MLRHPTGCRFQPRSRERKATIMKPIRRTRDTNVPAKRTRRSFVTALSAGAVGLAGRAFIPARASAAPTPPGCFGAPGCDTCSGDVCTGCYNGRSYNCQGVQGRTCWYTDVNPAPDGCFTASRCCDWFRSDFSVCICKDYVGIICPSPTPST